MNQEIYIKPNIMGKWLSTSEDEILSSMTDKNQHKIKVEKQQVMKNEGDC